MDDKGLLPSVGKHFKRIRTSPIGYYGNNHAYNIGAIKEENVVQMEREIEKAFQSFDVNDTNVVDMWQPIETAPTLTCVLVSYPISGKPRAVVTAIKTTDGDWIGHAASSNKLPLWGEYEPTHWQHLPKPPCE